MDWSEVARRWWRGAIALALLGALWMLAGPKQESVTPAALGGPGLGQAHGAAAGGAARTTPRVRHFVVHVAGAVRRPGVYKVLRPGRLIDAVRRAGGLTGDADLTQVNLAARLSDGLQIVVPRLAGAAGGSVGGSSGGGGGAAAGGSVSGGTGLAPGAKLSVNSATAEQLDTLDGIGPGMAAAIVEQRAKVGGFTKLEQLDEVPGVGEKRLASLREQLSL